MKRLVAGLSTGCLLAILFVTSLSRSRDANVDSPEGCIDELYEAMKTGDVRAYLDCFRGELRDQLESTVRRQGVTSFSGYLKGTVEPLKGRAIFGAEYANPDRVSLKVDRVYEARAWEYQTYRLECRSGGWKIYAVDPAELHDPPIPYGTPAYLPADGSAGTTEAGH